MALLTPLALDAAQKLGALYGLDVVGVRPILAGSVNSNVELSVAGGARAFLRIYEEQPLASASGEARLLAHLAAGGVKTPCPLALVGQPPRGGASRERTDDGGAAGFVTSYLGKAVAVFPWAEGEALCQARVTTDVAQTVGAALARIHVAGASYLEAPTGRFRVQELAQRVGALRNMALEPKLRADVEKLAARLDRFKPRVPPPEASGLVHGDFFRDNVLWKDGAITALLDFESASFESYAFDLMVAVLAWCFDTSLVRELARALVRGYVSVRPISPGEAASLYEEGSFAALRFSVTRITDFELRPRGTGAYKDYRRFFARALALDGLGQAGLLEFLDIWR